MLFDESDQKDQTEEYRPLKLEEIDSDIRHMENLLKELKRWMDRLPEVDEKGRAEFPFTDPEETYAIKEEAANDVVEHLKILHKVFY